MVENGSARRKKITLLEIAQEAGVSKSTVSMVLNDKPKAIPISEATKQRVMEAAKRLGYRANAAAKALATGRSYTVLMAAFDLWDENLTERLRGAEAYLTPHGYTIRMSTVDTKSGVSACISMLHSGQADGVLLTGLATPETYPILKTLKAETDSLDIPMVALANAFPPDITPVIADIDDEKGARDAVAHLIEHGHRRILLLGVAGQPWGIKREQGYRKALEEAGIPIEPELIVLGDRSQTWAYNTTLEIADSRNFTAMFAVTDNMAFAALSALREKGKRVPDDCAVVGFDNNEKIARFTDPPLTTVDNPFYESGKSAAEMLVNMLEGMPVEQKLLPVSLVIRQSCGCNRSKA